MSSQALKGLTRANQFAEDQIIETGEGFVHKSKCSGGRSFSGTLFF